MNLHHRHFHAGSLVALALFAACRSQSALSECVPPEGPKIASVYTVEQAIPCFQLPEGYRVELVASEPMVQEPVAIDFDADGRMYVVEMRGYMLDIDGTGGDRPIGRIVVLEDTDDDGQMDRQTVFMDSLVLPRSVGVLEHGVLVAATPNLWLARDIDGDLVADSVELLRDDYGTTESNPEHNANGFVWGLDNWIHNANFAGEFRLRDGEFEFRETPSEGQWGVSMDDYGRLYRNSNSDPLRADLIPAHYARRNENLETVRGVYERLTPNVPVWPNHPTPAVNRGYQPGTLRADSSLAQYTAAGDPTAYVGDRLPADLRNNIFVTESSGNLIGRFVITEEEDGSVTAHHAADSSSFLTSPDERFRPVSMYSAPDGTLYIVDMYHGIIQHRAYVTGYLEDRIRDRGMEQPTGMGRIYRIVHESTERDDRPELSEKTPAELVEYLSHPNGWWRITAQRLIVERGDKSVAPALRELAAEADDDRARLHAIWTLEGLGEADAATITTALSDDSPHVRAGALRIAEASLRQPESPLAGAVLALADDPSPLVRRQLAASVGEMPLPGREDALAVIAAKHGDDPIVADLVVSGLEGRELAFLERIVAPSSVGEPAATVQSLVAAVMRARDAAGIQEVLGWAGDEGRPRWQRMALLEGVRPADEGGRGRGGGFPGRGGGGGRGSGLELAAVPSGLLALAQSPDTALSTRAQGVAQVVSWPGKPRPPAPPPQTLSPEERQLLAAGEQHFAALCASCHQANGEGLAGVAKSLVGSRWALSQPSQVIRIVLHGKEGEMLMPPVGGTMTDEQVAAVLTYVRNSWGNEASPISVDQVAEIRGVSGARKQAWTEEELEDVRR